MNPVFSRILKKTRQKSIIRKVSGKSSAQKMIATLYRSFAIPNVVGNLSSNMSWTTRLIDPPEINLDELGRMRFTNVTDAPLYIVGRGNEREFRKLSSGSGFSTAGHNSLRISSQLSGEGNARGNIVILEYDESRNRIGELTIGPAAKVRGFLLPDTKYILPTIRIAGVGTIIVEWLHLELQQSRSHKTVPTDRIEPLQLSELATVDGRFTAIKGELTKLKMSIDRVDSELDEFYLLGENSVSPGQVQTLDTARSGSDISQTRERMARELLSTMANSLPTSIHSSHFDKIPLTAALITDEYMFNFYKDVFEKAVYLSPDNYDAVLKETSPDVIIYITCWKGMNDEEWKGIKFREKPMGALEGILTYAREAGKITIFQSIEDPSNFEYFLPVAKKFDWVFTSDINMIEDYKRELGHERVSYGEYGANPAVNNPVGSYRFNLNKAFFAGSYPERYPERCADMNQIFSGIPDRDSNLVILDRNFNGEGYEFPAEYQSSILGPVSHEVLQKMHKLFRVSLNFNSIKGSPTMCAMRVYELQAQGKPIISNYARSVFNRFPGIRIVAHDANLDELRVADPFYEELESANTLMTQLFAEKSSFHVVSDMLAKVGLPGATERSRKILVVALGSLENILQKVASQVGVHATVISETEFLQNSHISSNFGYITAMNEGLDYEPYYLLSRLNVFVYSDALFATQLAMFRSYELEEGPIHEFVEKSSSRDLTLASTECPGIEDFFLGRTGHLEGNGYAADPFGVGYSRYLANNLRASLASSPKLSVIVPVYNNGTFLATKCIPSIRRNDMWNEMEIILVDDGSTDESTFEICELLEKRYENVRYFSFDDGGSGSASRPRNKGIELARADLITFLDPDNEISPHGYDNLVAEFESLTAKDEEIDFVSGYQVKVSETTRFTGRHTAGETRIVKSAKEDFFNLGKFPVVSTQAAVMRKNFLVENDISFIEKAAGQDTLFGWQVLGKARTAGFVDSAYILYFAEREGSVTNQLDPSYFLKSLELEKKQVPFLKEMGVFDIYKNSQFDYFMRNWYLEKFSRVAANEQPSARAALEMIAKLYDVELNDYLA